MPHFIHISQVKPELRQKHLRKYKLQLREALLRPGLSVDQKIEIKERLQQIGKPKDYDPNLAPVPGAIENGTAQG